jgi:hypothetical protein
MFEFTPDRETERHCQRAATINDSFSDEAYDDCLQWEFLAAYRAAHDEWWQESAPEPWHLPFVVGAWQPHEDGTTWVIDGDYQGFRRELPRAA